ncbi:Alkylmercury lyase [Candidatus Methylomirabilis lanthanidiphila]|uniref:Alkylmercury lyase n=1 Tax=Candidatus Methylomirabilis lanthanidiphila TaxID=2211376 RepID=A0A564ZJE9_9BACT|nr:hypothetical protein [Candidatus Methylomirabilis lanthanidiphila]VUZ84997.1 Alkylmercury lyase [Candidatus Methylomirabilis lanthanidiphila]
MWGQLTANERRARKALLDLILTTGRGPSLKALASRLEVSESEAAELLSALERKGCLVRGQRSNMIKAAYPLSTRPTQHCVALNGTDQQCYALCAIDALGVAPLFGVPVTVSTACQQCGRPISIVLRPGGIVSCDPSTTAVYDSLPQPLTRRSVELNLAKVH